MYKNYTKRIFDFVFAITFFFFFIPVFLLIIIVSFSQFKGKVFFVQERVGQGGRIFHIYKFRSLREVNQEINEEQRLTAWGKFLRVYSLDELPQLYNIIIGDLSLVGPRPLLKEYIHFYTLEEMQRHSVLPGLTGLAQINGRNQISWKKKFMYDLHYVNNISCWLDLKIIFLTVLKLFQPQPVIFTVSLVKERA